MIRKIYKTLLFILAFVILVFALRFLIGGSEDDWICVDGEWIKHGVPSAPMPTELCE